MDFVALIEQAGLRVVSGRHRVQAALSYGLEVMACDAEGFVYRIVVKDNSLDVQEVSDQQVDGSMIIVAPTEPKANH